MAEFKIGGKCIALHTSANDIGQSIVRGQIYIVKGLSSNHCGCKFLFVDIGLRNSKEGQECGLCKEKTYPPITWVSEKLLAPIDEVESQESIDELLDRILESEKEKA